MEAIKFSVVIPVYRNEESIPRLLQALADLYFQLDGKMEAVFVVDGSPDSSFEILRDALFKIEFPAQLLAHSRNFGSFPAIRTGLAAARGSYYGVMAADLQEPPQLMVSFLRSLEKDECDVAIGTRVQRNDSTTSKFTSGLFWWLYRRLIVPEMPEGGVDVFGCNKIFRDRLLELEESRSSLIALIFWLGFRRKTIGYERLARKEGVSAWTFRKKVDYMLDSIFAFTDYPIRLLTRIGLAGCGLSIVLTLVVLLARFSGNVTVPGYVPTMLVVLFFGALNLLGIGLVGTYAWRTYENSKNRPLAVVAMEVRNGEKADE
ncbi:glycosyl transferase [Pseudorhodoferax aquiterrae]|uniref:Glycosyl transferase n=1 Tax=Pseudorhodoferax aquiterrae TaxID=747304 RepID=A0ABQ3G4G0_9BURK|nr:glycosyltransferase family 2 protein [Pseudorhodoferax aquiterrae]GHC87705.1 glycosyl transferase [Pseudorhodoferax aquiterrae]